MIPNTKFMKEVFPLVENDFKAYQANAKLAAFGDAKPNEEVIARLKFAL